MKFVEFNKPNNEKEYWTHYKNGNKKRLALANDPWTDLQKGSVVHKKRYFNVTQALSIIKNTYKHTVEMALELLRVQEPQGWLSRW